MSSIKIGTADFTGRVVSGVILEGEPGSVVLRQLFPGEPADIGVIDQIEAVSAQLTIHPGHRRAWTETDRSALAQFFADRYRDRSRFADLLECVAVLGGSANAR
ncbi:MAG: hypothetical protein HOQ24_16720 [Mycobacteriaceae bacterium]|nr:hypothetical protein [Mycobacteriaceae bacterium]